MNPVTYLKGSVRHQWLRGHNYLNASRYMCRLSRRLEGRKRFTLLDYYAMGKLIHYTVDAFTFSHNAYFSAGLQSHRKYENQLQGYFLPYLQQYGVTPLPVSGSVMDAIRTHHDEYIFKPASVHSDSRYCVLVTSLVLCMLLA